MKPYTLAFALICLGFVCTAASAISVTAQILDAAGQPVTDAAVYAEPVSGQVLPKSTRATQIEQLRAWHFGMPAGAPIPEQAITGGGSDINASFTRAARTHNLFCVGT